MTLKMDYEPATLNFIDEFDDMVRQMRDRLFQLEEVREEVRVLYEIGAAINKAEDEQAIVEAIVAQGLDPSVNSVAIILWENVDFDRAKMMTIAGDWRRDEGDVSMRGLSLPLSDFPFLPMLNRDHVNISDDIENDETIEPLSRTILINLGTSAFIFAPLTVGKRWIGTIGIYSDAPRIHSVREIRQLHSIAELVTAAVERLRLNQETQKFTAQMQMVAEVGTAISTILDLEKLLQTVTDLTKSRFELYHAHIYLLNETGDILTLAAGADDPGRIMRERGHSIPMSREHSLVARAARSRRGAISNNVVEEPDFLANPLLPNTKSEMAIPMLIADKLLGVLDVQADVFNRFKDDDVQVQTALVAQIAVAVENARTFERLGNSQSELLRRAAEMETVAVVSAAAASVLDTDDLLQAVSDLTKDNFGLYHAHIYLLDETGENLVLAAGAGEAGRAMLERGHRIPKNREHSLVARAARTQSGVVSNDVTQEPDFLPNPLLPDTKSEMAIPMISGDKLIGVLDVQAAAVNRFDDNDMQVQSTLGSQIAVAVQNARAFAQLREAQEETDRIYNLSLDMIGSAGFDGYFKFLNPAWHKILGYTDEELLAKPFIEFVHPDDRDMTNQETAKFAQGAAALSFENRYIAKDGSYHWISWHIVPLLERQSHVLCCARHHRAKAAGTPA